MKTAHFIAQCLQTPEPNAFLVEPPNIGLPIVFHIHATVTKRFVSQESGTNQQAGHFRDSSRDSNVTYILRMT